jgi:hypothetical protein
MIFAVKFSFVFLTEQRNRRAEVFGNVAALLERRPSARPSMARLLEYTDARVFLHTNT